MRDGNNVAIGQYFYDGEGKRVKKVITATGETTVFVYSNGKLVAEYSNNIAGPSEAKIAYTTTDHLGSPRVITDDIGQVRSRRDFLPFGEGVNVGIGGRTGESGQGYDVPTDGVRQKFTGYQKDTETSLDFAEARMYENRFGRFTAVDPLLPSGKSAAPQTFNRYSYISNNPIIDTDPSGQCPTGKCPSTHRGLVYTRDENGVTKYNNEQPDASWILFTGTALITEKTDNYQYRIFSDGTYSGSGWYRINPTVQALIGGFNQGLDDVQSGSWTGLKNVPSTFWNTATTAASLPFASVRSGQSGLPELFIPNPFLVQGYEYKNERQARWGQQFTAAAIAAPAVFAAPFAGATSSLSIASTGSTAARTPLSTSALIQRAANIAERRVGGTSPVAGTLKHTYARRLLERYQGMYGNRGLEFETSFRAGQRVNYGTRGSIRFDVLDTGSMNVYDFKFGAARLTSSRAAQFRFHGPSNVRSIFEVRP